MYNQKIASRSIISASLGVDPNVEIIQEQRSSFMQCIRRLGITTALPSSGIRSVGYSHSIEKFTLLTNSLVRNNSRKKKEKRRKFFDRVYGLTETDGFGDFCRWLNTPYRSDASADRHFLSRYLQIRLDGGKMPDFIGRFENIETDWNRVTTHLGMPTATLPLLETISGWRPTPEALKAVRTATAVHLTRRNKALLRTRYVEGLKLGSYPSE